MTIIIDTCQDRNKKEIQATPILIPRHRRLNGKLTFFVK